MMNQRTPTEPDDRQAYSEAMQMLRYEGNSTWQRFNAFLVAHGLLTGFLIRYGLEDSASLGRSTVLLAAAFLGLVACLLWWSAFERSTTFFDLRVHQARRFEPSAWAFLNEGELLSRQGYCEVHRASPVSVEMPLVGKFRLRSGPRTVIASFSLFYYFLAWYSLYALLGSSFWGLWLWAGMLSLLGPAIFEGVMALSRRTKSPKPLARRDRIGESLGKGERHQTSTSD